MNIVELNIDEKYVFQKAKLDVKYIELVNQGVIIRKNLNAGIIGSRILLSQKGNKKYIKLFFLWISIFLFPIKGFSKLIYSNHPNVDVVFFGRSKRVKVIKDGVIFNKMNNDQFSVNDYYIRKKINNLGVSPKILETHNGYYIEELLVSYKTLKSNDLADNEVSIFKSRFKTFTIEKEKYVSKISCRIKSIDKKIGNKLFLYKPEGKLKIRISHGDLIHKNILRTNSAKIYLIDFEFTAYRSFLYDDLFVLYYNDREGFYKGERNFYRYLFAIERLFLVLRLQNELKISYSSEVDSLVSYIETYRSEF